MENAPIERQNGFRPKMICNVLYKVFYYLGNKFYIISEKCVYFSKDRDRKIAIDKKYEERQNVGEMVLDNEKLKDKVLKSGDFKMECDEVVKEFGNQYISNKNELGNCYETVYELWLAHLNNDIKRMDKIFKNVGLEKDNFKGEDNVNFE
ncbi:MAG TPA: hypothetical protein EYG74_00510 [Sulfurimonas autotrophica]|nr:hypothetical protein [Sulfurimonas autotrophica]